MLYNRNYLVLTDEETLKIEKAKIYLENCKRKNDGGINPAQLLNYHKKLPEAFYHSTSLFPNNYIMFDHHKHGNSIDEKKSKFQQLLNKDCCSEREVLNYIKDTKSYFILESLFYSYDFGHHDAYLFREFELHPNYISDFLLVGKNSSGYEFIFIEFESPIGEITLKDGELGKVFRKGIKQIDDWDFWLENNFHSLKSTFHKFKNPLLNLPKEFYELDKTRIHYLVVAGRREHFNDKTYRIKRKLKAQINIKHYDNLLDEIDHYVRVR